MGVMIREADLASDRDALLETLLRNREHRDAELRRAQFEWSYYRNPFGRPRAWLAIDSSSSRVVGMVGAFPRPMRVDGRPVQGWNGGDTSIDREFRTLGVALKLRREVKACVDRAEMALLYSHPVDRMRTVLEKVGHKTIGLLARHGVVLRADAVLRRIIGDNRAAAVLAALANGALRVQWSHDVTRRKYRVHVQSTLAFGDEYDQLYERVRDRYRAITVRSSEFLRWRFADNPTVRNAALFRLEEGDTFRGYALVGLESSAARILDLLVDGDRRANRALLVGVIRQLRANGVSTLAIRATRTSPILREARLLGFVFQDRSDSGISVYTARAELSRTVMDEQNWFMTQADRDR